MYKYKFYQHNNEVIAVSTYAGRNVKGIAKCDPEDEFDLESGKELAAARCNQKIAMKRLKRASQKYEDALDAALEAQQYFVKMREYFMDSVDALDEATAKVIEITERL